jgi:hypothetical protein
MFIFSNNGAPSSSSNPKGDCPEQDTAVQGGNGFTSAELTAIVQTALGEASNKFYANEVEFSFATVINRQTINMALHAGTNSTTQNVFNGGTFL